MADRTHDYSSKVLVLIALLALLTLTGAACNVEMNDGSTPDGSTSTAEAGGGDADDRGSENAGNPSPPSEPPSQQVQRPTGPLPENLSVQSQQANDQLPEVTPDQAEQQPQQTAGQTTEQQTGTEEQYQQTGTEEQYQQTADQPTDTVLEQPGEILTQTPQATQAPDGAEPLAQAGIEGSVEGLTTLLQQDIDPFWVQRFQNWGAYTSPGIVWYDQPKETPCGPIKPDVDRHLYCSTDETVYMSVPAAETYEEQWGDFANVWQLAHEAGHHIQNKLGYFDPSIRDERIHGRYAAFENQADCLAGVWAYSAYGQGKIGEADVSEVIAASEGLADSRTPEQGQTHGNVEQRQGWFLYGFQTGDPSVCAT